MRILFDQGTPAPLRAHLPDHDVETSYERGWASLSNGDLLAAAQSEGFEILLTTDQNLRHEQNLSGRSLGIVVLLSTSWPRIQNHLSEIRQAVDAAAPTSYIEIPIE